MRFTQFGVSATCSPTRSMLLSGTDNHLAGLGNMAEFMAPNQKGKPGYEGYLNERVAPLPALLKDAGYNTYMAGKWHMGEEPEHWPAARGFMRDLTLIPGGGSHMDDMWGAKGERQLYTYNGKPIEALRPGFHSSEDYTAAIINNIEENRGDGKPFFAYLALQAPHDPFQLPPEWRDRYKGRYDQGYDETRAARIERMKTLGILDPKATVFPRLPNVPAWNDLPAEEKRKSARRMELYAAMVEHMDANIGKLIGYLKTKGLYDNTLIIFLSDNGPEGNVMEMGAPWDNSNFEDWGKKGTFIQYGPAWAQVGAGPVPHVQGLPVGGRHRTPLIISGKGVTGSGRISDAARPCHGHPGHDPRCRRRLSPRDVRGQEGGAAAGQGSCADPEQCERARFAGPTTGSAGSSSAIAPSGRATGSCCGCASPSAPANGSCST